MKKYEYDVSLHPAAQFRRVAVFCGVDGECNVGDVPDDQLAALKRILNDRGADGWDLAQLAFGRDGVMAVWRREAG